MRAQNNWLYLFSSVESVIYQWVCLQAMTEPKDQNKPEAAIAEVERLRDKLVGRSASTGSGWSVTGWRSVDWLLLALVLSFVLYMLLPRF